MPDYAVKLERLSHEAHIRGEHQVLHHSSDELNVAPLVQYGRVNGQCQTRHGWHARYDGKKINHYAIALQKHCQ